MLTYLGSFQLLILILGSTLTVCEARTFGGVINQDLTIINAGGPHDVLSKIIVQPRVKLTIEAGAELRFSPGAGILVHGELEAIVSTQAQHVV